MVDHVKATVLNLITLQSVTNKLVTDSTPMQICNDMINLTSLINDNEIKVATSLIAPRNDRKREIK